MTLIHGDAARNAISNAVVDLIDSGTTDPTGDIVYKTAGNVDVSVSNFSNPAFGGAVAGVATANAVTPDGASPGGLLAKAIIQDRDNVQIFEGTVTVTGGGGDVEVSSILVAPNEPIVTTLMTYTASA